MKSFESIDVASNKIWSAAAFSYLSVVTEVPVMYSLIRAADFVNYEGVWSAPFNKDVSDENEGLATNWLYKIYNGRPLRARSIEVTLSATPSDETAIYLLSVKINSDISK